jgi:hypothetical protein
VSQFLLGLFLLGGDELLGYLQSAQREIEAAANPSDQAISASDTKREPVTYLAIGAVVRGQKRLARGLRRGMRTSMAAAGWTFGAMDRLTDNALGRALRGPIERLLDDLVQEGEGVVRERQQEAQSARLLASQTLGVMARDLVAGVAKSPAVTESIQQVVGQQGVELTGTMMDSLRQVSAGADGRAEGVVRRLLRRRPRRELPPSPLAGKPLTMYLSWDQTREDGTDGRQTGSQ